ncbi:hypothetical protein OG21DRAFT_1025441 [Imleria badia]|nr:hypothetical protein OG21DRAFT_1025441 [Imleria badia]
MADIFEKSDGWVETPQPVSDSILLLPHDKQRSRVYAIDCEMCFTEDSKELTRACIIDYESGIVVYDTLTKYVSFILSYLIVDAHSPPLCRRSGPPKRPSSRPRPSLQESKPTSSPSSHPQVSPPRSSLVTPSKPFESATPFCIDTALVYRHPRGRPLKPGLAWLTKKWCRRKIQTCCEGRHDPEEDARACVD